VGIGKREGASKLAASSGVSERMPLVSRLRFGSATLEAESLLSDTAVPSRGGAVVIAVGGAGGGGGADGQPAGTSHETVWVGE
jgi:hypothetical protein